MKKTLKASLLNGLHSSTERLQRAIDMHSYLLASTYDPMKDRSCRTVDKLSRAFTPTLSDLNEQLDNLESGEELSTTSIAQSTPSESLASQILDSYHDTMRKQCKRLHSWPSREVDTAFDHEELEGGFEANFIPRIKALESTAALSLATFTSLIIEFVARLDHLVEAVDELSKLAKFKDEIL